jgi:hypothetical protein
MKATETLNKIAHLLNVDLSTQEEVKLEQVKLENGTVIEAESFEAGQSVFIVTEDERVALPIGEYDLEGGQVLVVAEEGVIAELREAGAEEPVAEEEVEEVEAAEEEEKEEMGYATKEELGAAIDELKGMIDEIKAMMSPKEEEMSEEPQEEVKEEAKEELSAAPAAKPIKSNPEVKQQPNMKAFAHNAKATTLDRVLAKISQR